MDNTYNQNPQFTQTADSTCTSSECHKEGEHHNGHNGHGSSWFGVWPLKQIGLAATGACVMAKEEAGYIFNKLVEKGQHLVEKGQHAGEESKSWVKNYWEKGRQQTKETVQNAVDVSFENIEKVLDKMNIPKKSDLEELSKRVDALTEKIEALKNTNI